MTKPKITDEIWVRSRTMSASGSDFLPLARGIAHYFLSPFSIHGPSGWRSDTLAGLTQLLKEAGKTDTTKRIKGHITS
jgi:hypothetical protein